MKERKERGSQWSSPLCLPLSICRGGGNNSAFARSLANEQTDDRRDYPILSDGVE